MYRFGLRLCAVLMLTLAGSDGFQWTANLPDNTVMYACVNDDLRLPWRYTTSFGDDITVIQWFFQGRSQEMIAFYSRPNFAPLAAFSNRVQHVPNAGIVLSHVVGADSGNYTVEISGHDASGSSFTYRRTVVVQVTDNDQLMTTDGSLHATLEPQAIYSNRTGEWSLVVSCGTFTYLGDPPFVMEWLTPSGAVCPSTRYEDGRFQLEVLSGGDYTCRIPQQAAGDVCLVQSPRNATVHVDRMEARMTLVEARQAQLQREKELQDRYIHDLEQRLDAKDRLLDNKDASLTQSLQSLSNKVSRRIGFTARAENDPPSTGIIRFIDVKINYGSRYSSSTGKFTASVAGLYYFSTTNAVDSNSYYPYSEIKKEGSTICKTTDDHTPGGYGGSGSCGGVVHLNVGEQVWVESSQNMDNDSTFTGFLIVAD